ncbi:MAG: lipopeptide [Alphaproteobacteria bacterium]|nr:lipopeptide [Alphaproteobacteria bacterium]
MKKVFIAFLVLVSLAVAGCGAKSALYRPDSSFPRAYPVN